MTQQAPGVAEMTPQAAQPSTATATGTVAPTPAQQLGQEELKALTDILAHVNRQGTGTSEFWAPIAAPLATFVVTTGTGLLVTAGVGTSAQVEALAPLAVGTLTAVLSHFGAQAYSSSRSGLKVALANVARAILARTA